MKQHTMARMEIEKKDGTSVYIHLGRDEQAKCFNLTVTWSEGAPEADSIKTYGLARQAEAVRDYLGLVKYFSK